MRTPRFIFLPLLLIACLFCSQPVSSDVTGTTLFELIRAGNLEQMRNLLALGDVEINSRDAQGLTPLMRAVEMGQANIVRELLDHGAEIDATIAFYGITALTLAERDNNTEIIQILLAAGARPDVKDSRDERPIVPTRVE